MKKITVAIAVLVAVCFTTVTAHADNPADNTLFYRAFPAKFVKVNLLPNSGKVLFVNTPVNEKVNVNATEFSSKGGAVTTTEGNVSTKTGDLDLGVYTVALKIKGVSGTTSINTFGIDLNNEVGSINAVLPLDNNSDARIGGRLKIKSSTLYLTTTPGHQNSTLAGITISRKGVSLDLAGNTDRGGISSLHLSTSVKSSLGTLCPHLTVDLDTGKIGGYLGLLF